MLHEDHLARFSLEGRRALVTGSSQGVGWALAGGLREAGAEIILNGRNEERLAAAAETLSAEGARVHVLPFDVTDHAAARAAIDRFEAETGAIDILVNNAAMHFRAPLESFPRSGFRSFFRPMSPRCSTSPRPVRGT